MRDVIVIGGGHNGLVAAAYLARAGLKPLVLERSDEVGGGARTGEIAPGFRSPTLAHAIGPLRASIVEDLQLARHGFALLTPDPCVFAPAPDGRALVIHRDERRTAEAIARFSARDAARWPGFAATLGALAGCLRSILESTPPSVNRPEGRDLWSWLMAGRRFRALGRANGFRLLRYMPMAVADLAGEWFETDLLRATVAARGVFGTRLGPRSAGTGANLLLAAAWDPAPAGSGMSALGGPGGLARTLADAARAAGAWIRVETEVARILVRDGAVAGVALTTGEEIFARAVVSNADPKRTLLGLVDPDALTPEFADDIRHYRCEGATAKLNLALDALPRFTAVTSGEPAERLLGGRIHIGPSLDYLDRAFDAAKYGRISDDPYLDVTIPSLLDASLAPPGKHVMSIVAHCAPFRLRAGDWTKERETLADRVMRTLTTYAPDLPSLVRHLQVITPVDLEERFGLTGGHIHHGEPALDQLFVARPVFGWARYRTPVKGLYLCGAGTHPGGGITGAPGANAAREILKDVK
jgi:phytoene dehydrogenase-like protein